jgi:hypothetical protein
MIFSVNVFKGVLNNKIFCTIFVTTSILQVLIVQFGGFVMHCVQGGLSWEYWLVSLGLGFCSLPVQQIINLIYRIGLNSTKQWRTERRRKRGRHITVDFEDANRAEPAPKDDEC